MPLSLLFFSTFPTPKIHMEEELSGPIHFLEKSSFYSRPIKDSLTLLHKAFDAESAWWGGRGSIKSPSIPGGERNCE